jgi:hypothetical protein
MPRQEIPIQQGEAAPATGSRNWDEVDQASWESFPASDAPAHRLEASAERQGEAPREPSEGRASAQGGAFDVREITEYAAREVREHPWRTLGIAAGVGLFVGMSSRGGGASRVGRTLFRIALGTAERAGVGTLAGSLQPRMERALSFATQGRSDDGNYREESSRQAE